MRSFASQFKMADLTGETIDDKVVLIGHAGVGKSALFTRLKDPDKFVEGDDVAITAQEAHYQRKYANGSSLTLFDTAGMEKFQTTLPPTYFHFAKGVMFVYDVSEVDNFEGLVGWIDGVEGFIPQDVVKVIVGNKCDLEKRVKDDRAKQLAKNVDIPEDMVFFVSAKTNAGVSEMFEKIASKMSPVAERRQPPPHQPSSHGKCCAKK